MKDESGHIILTVKHCTVISEKFLKGTFRANTLVADEIREKRFMWKDFSGKFGRDGLFLKNFSYFCQLVPEFRKILLFSSYTYSCLLFTIIKSVDFIMAAPVKLKNSGEEEK